MRNLLDNAIRYTPQGGHVAVYVAQRGEEVLLTVDDDGPGLPDDELEAVFEPFHRGERSRNRDTGGIGLGLSSVRGVARAHGGDATIANHPGGGAVARVTLPV